MSDSELIFFDSLAISSGTRHTSKNFRLLDEWEVRIKDKNSFYKLIITEDDFVEE